MHLPARMMFKT